MTRKSPSQIIPRPARSSGRNLDFLAGGGRMGKLIRGKDWSKTALGPPEQWPQSLRSALSLCLHSKFPTAIYWGPELTVLYNDAWSPIPGDKHPWALGRPGCEVWADIWNIIAPVFEQVVAGGKGTLSQDMLLPMLRHGFVEECYFDYTFTPIFGGDGRVEGVFNVGSEVTRRLIAERRAKLLRDLAGATIKTASPDEVYTKAAGELKKTGADVPFALFYDIEESGGVARLCAASGIAKGKLASPAKISLSGEAAGVWPIERVLKTGKEEHVGQLAPRLGKLHGGPWKEPVTDALVLPIRQSRQKPLHGVLVAGLSPRLLLNKDYRDFFKQIAGQTAAAIEDALGEEQKMQLVKREREAQEQLSAAFSTGSVGAWVWNLKEDKVIADKNSANRFGVDVEEAAQGLPVAAFVRSIHPEDRQRVKGQIAQAIKKGSTFESEYKTINANGSVCWVMARGRVEKDNQGKPFRFPGVIVDITDRRRAEEAERQSSAQFRFMTRSIPQKVFTADSNGNIDYFNPQWMEFTGLSFEQIRDWGWTSFIHPDDIDENIRQWEHSVRTGEPFQFEHRFRRADGVYRWHLSRAQPMRNEKGDIIKWMGSNTDIEEQKQAEINMSFLARASKALSSSLDYEQALKRIADMVVPIVADWCVIDLYETPDIWKLVALTHKEPGKVKWALDLRKRLPHAINAPRGVPKVVRTGRLEYYPMVTDEMLRYVAKDKMHLKLLREVGFASAMIVPLKMQKKTVGAITFVSSEQKRHFTKADLEMAKELAVRASHAITNASLYVSLKEELEKRNQLEHELRMVNERLEMWVKQRTAQLEATNNGLKDQILKRESAEKTLFAEREFLQAVLGSVDAGIVACNAQGVLTYFNRATRDFHGLPQKSIPAEKWAQHYNLYHPDGKTPMEQKDVPLFRALAGERIENVEMVIVPKRGKVRTLLASGQIMTNQSGQKTGAVVAMQDISELKQAERSLKEYADSLARSNEELQSFAYVASHDLQEPLRKIQAFGNLLEEEHKEALGGGKDYLTRMQGAASRMSGLIEDLLAFSRVTTKTSSFALVDLQVITAEVASDLEMRVRETKGKIEITDLPTIAADPTQMRQLLQNLIGNALKFHRQDVPPVVKVYARQLKAAKGEAARWRLFVKDNGIGFEEKYLDRIFSVFQRLHGRDSYEGTGIGLAVCRKIVERHNGTITAESKIGKGSTFIITLPIDQQEGGA